ncbi:hypothetical protein BDR26DRAFT_214834 [Obelidium mucronatum]|nr:hypothetical protein BDR26DRAFT_214834 [Obelidium mucronatum]
MALVVATHVAYIVFISVGLAFDSSKTAPQYYAAFNMIVYIGWMVCHSLLIGDESLDDSSALILMFGAYLVAPAFLSFIAWFHFAAYTGYNIVQYVSTFGFAEWRTLPLLYQLIYFNVWLHMFLVVASMLAVPVIIYYGCFEVQKEDSSEQLEQARLDPQPKPEPLVAISTVSLLTIS